ncbi:MAG: patatin-like phospholipase family protein [Spirochaetia bacterium]|nr:patatin-like phospholipase family protein [Spirochaetia bacterium]
MAGKKLEDNPINHQEFLAMAPLFAGVIKTSPAFQAFVRRVQLVKFTKGRSVYGAGQPPTHLYLVRDGEIQIRQSTGAGETVLAIQRRGSVFGEVSFLAGDLHSSTALAALDSHVYLIPQEAFTDVMAIEPTIGEALARILSQRLRNRMQAQPDEIPARVFTLLDAREKSGGDGMAGILCRSLSDETPGRVLLISFRGAPGKSVGTLSTFLERWQNMTLDDVEEMLGGASEPYDVLDASQTLSTDVNAGAVVDAVPAALGLLKKYYSCILVDGGVSPDHEVVQRFQTQSDKLILLRDVFPEGRTESRLRRMSAHTAELVPDFHTRTILVVDDPTPVSGTRAANVRDRGTDPGPFRDFIRIHTGAGRDSAIFKTGLHRLARRLTGTSRGLCLGGGGARAFAHIGVLEVLEKEGIDFDAVSGTSMGAVIGAGYAMGFSAAEITDLVAEHLPAGSSVLDKTLPIMSFFKGKRLNQAILKFYGDTKFEDLEIPFFCNGSDLNTGRMIVFEKGYLSTALRATVSLPGVFPPFTLGNYTIVDGGVLNNLPGDLLRERGYNRVIGVNVTPELDRKMVLTEVSPDKSVLKGLRDYFHIPPILRVITRALAIESQELLKFRMEDFDFVFQPDVASFDMFAFEQREGIIAQGRRAAEDHIDDIKEALARKSAR